MGRVSRETALRIIYWNLVAAVMIVCIAGVSFVRRIHRYDELIINASHEYGVDPRLISAVIWQESKFKPDCVGTKKEIGLMQVTEGAAKEWAKGTDVASFKRDDLFDPRINIEAGTWYLARAIRRWEDNCKDPLPFALAEYNAGRSNAERWARKNGTNARAFWEGIDYPTTKKYVSNILKRYRGKV